MAADRINDRFNNLARYPIVSIHRDRYFDNHPEMEPGERFRDYIARVHHSGHQLMIDVTGPRNTEEPRQRLYEARFSSEDIMGSLEIVRQLRRYDPTVAEVIAEENRISGTNYRQEYSYQDGYITVYLGHEIMNRYLNPNLYSTQASPVVAESKIPDTEESLEAQIPTAIVNNRIVADGRIHAEPGSGVPNLVDLTSFTADSDSETVGMPELVEVFSEDSNSEEEVEEELVGSGDSEDVETDNSVESHMMTVNPYFRRKAIPRTGIFESSFDDSDEDSSDVGEVIVTNLQPIPETDKIIADSGASRSVVNSRFPGPLTGLQPCSGSILGSDPTSTKGRITGRAWTTFRGERIRVFIGNVPKSVVAINDVTATTPISFLFKRGECVVQHDDQRVQSRITTREGLTYLPVEMFTKSY